MKLAFATLGCPQWPLDRVIRAARELGYEGVELRVAAGEPVHLEMAAEARATVKAHFAEAGIAIASLMGYTNFVANELHGDDLAKERQLLRLAADLGCPVVRIFGGQLGEISRETGTARIVAALRELIPVAEEAGVAMALETHDDWCRGAHLEPLLEQLPSSAFGICWDACNSFFMEPLETTFAVLRERLLHVHLKDAIEQNGHHHGRLPGEGEVDLAGIVALLRAADYQGFVSFEWEKKWQPDLAEPEVAFPHFSSLMRQLLKNGGR